MLKRNTKNSVSSCREVLSLRWGAREFTLEGWKFTDAGWSCLSQTTDRWVGNSDVHSQTVLRGQQLRHMAEQVLADSRTVVVHVPVDRILIKQVELPPTEQPFLADAIALQMESKGISGESFVLDFVAVGGQPSDGKMLFVVAAIARDVVEEIQAVVEESGLSLAKIVIAESGLVSPSPDDEVNWKLLILDCHSVLQCAVFRNGRLISSNGFGISSEISDGAAIVAAMTRTWYSIPEEPRSNKQVIVELLTKRPESFRGLIQQVTDAELVVVEPTVSGSCFGLGSVQQYHANRSDGIDFASPRRGGDLRGATRRKYLVHSVRAVLAMTLLVLLQKWYLDGIESRTAALASDLREKNAQLESLEEDFELASGFIDWQKQGRSWMDDFTQLAETMPGNDRVYLESITAEMTQGESAELQIMGIARELDDALSLNRSLLERLPHYELRPDQVENRDNDPHYRVNFVLAARIQGDDVSVGSHDPRESSDDQ